MRFLSWLLIMLVAFGTAQAASLEKDIVTGAFGTPKQANFRNTKLEAYLGHEPAVIGLMKEKRFYFDVKYANGKYRSVLTHFIDADEMLTVMQSVKRIYPDAYVIDSTSTVIPPVAKKTASPEPAVAAPVKKPAPKPAPAVVPAAPAPVAAAGDAPESTTADVVEEDIIVVDETEPDEAVEASAAATTEVVVPVAEDAIEIETAVPADDEASESNLLLYGIFAAVIVLAALFFIARPRRKKTPIRPLETPKPIIIEEEAPAPAAEAPAEPEPEAAPVVEAAPEPVAEEAPVPPAAEELVPEKPAAPAGVSPRKKRDLPAHMGEITKESLSDFAGSRILVAEDNLINQKVITKLLEESGIEIVMANNGQEAIDILANDPNFNMVLMDAHMPVKDGFEATREIRQNILFEPIVVVALSGDVSSDDIRKMREAGMEEQLAKPLRVEALYSVFYQYLDLAGEEPVAAEEEILPEIKGHKTATPLNSMEGLEVCGGDKGMYAEILDEFAGTYGKSDALVDDYIASHDDGKLVALMLDIKGVAANIGADPLSEAAEILREAVLINQTEAYERLAREFKAELHKALSAIDTFKGTL